MHVRLDYDRLSDRKPTITARLGVSVLWSRDCFAYSIPNKNDPRGSAVSARVVLSLSCYRPASSLFTAASTSRWSDSRPRGTTTYVRLRNRTRTLRGTSNNALPSGDDSARATKSPRGVAHGHTRTSPIPAGSSSPVTSSSRAKDQLTASPPADSAWNNTCTAYGSAGSYRRLARTGRAVASGATSRSEVSTSTVVGRMVLMDELPPAPLRGW